MNGVAQTNSATPSTLCAAKPGNPYTVAYRHSSSSRRSCDASDCSKAIGRLPPDALASVDGGRGHARLLGSDHTRGYHAEPCNKHVQADRGAWGRGGSNPARSDGQDFHRARAEKDSFHGLADGDVPEKHGVVR